MLQQQNVILQTVLTVFTLNSDLQNSSLIKSDLNESKKFFNDSGYFLKNITGEGTFRCYPPYGCFSIEHPWPLNRPANFLPEHPNKIDTKFCLYTRSNIENCQILSYNVTGNYVKPKLKGDKKTFIIIHGYVASWNKPWVKKMANEILKFIDGNVIAVDWQGGSGPPYAQAVANTRLVGRVVAMLLNKLRSYNLILEECHIIGHSLGSHIAGYTGSDLSNWKLKLGRITGLDPAEPHFVDTDKEVRLDPSDALYVDVIHTDAAPFISGGFGLQQPVGHLDFYPNGGESQPGCSHNIMGVLGYRRGMACNHIRSHQLFIESINSQCEFFAVECESWAKFEAGECFGEMSNVPPHAVYTNRCNLNQQYYNAKSVCTKFGFHSLPVPAREQVQMFFKTSGAHPFCLHHYRIEIEISNSSSSFNHGGEVGEFLLEIHGSKGRTEKITLQNSASYFEPGSKRRRVVAGTMVGEVEAATVEWVFRSSVWNPLTWRLLTRPQIYLEALTIDVLETQQSLHICPDHDPLISGSPRTFTASRNRCPSHKFTNRH